MLPADRRQFVVMASMPWMQIPHANRQERERVGLNLESDKMVEGEGQRGNL